MPDERKNYAIKITAYFAVILWIIRLAFDLGTMYASNVSREYTDKQVKELRTEILTEIKSLNNNLENWKLRNK